VLRVIRGSRTAWSAAESTAPAAAYCTSTLVVAEPSFPLSPKTSTRTVFAPLLLKLWGNCGPAVVNGPVPSSSDHVK